MNLFTLRKHPDGLHSGKDPTRVHRPFGLFWLLLLAGLSLTGPARAESPHRIFPGLPAGAITRPAGPAAPDHTKGGHPNAALRKKPILSKRVAPGGNQRTGHGRKPLVLTVTCPNDVTISCTDDTDPTSTGEPMIATDCPLMGDITISWTDTIQPASCDILRTFFVTNPCDEMDTCQQYITIPDDEDPTFDPPADIPPSQQLSCNDDLTPVTTGFPLNLEDNCTTDQASASSGYTANATIWVTASGYTVAYADAATDPQPWAECSLSPEMDIRKLEISRLWTITDRCGRSTTALQTIAIIDNDPPEWDQPMPADMTVECDAIPAPPVITATDDCDGNRPVNFQEQSSNGPSPYVETITRTWSVEDLCGNTSVHTQVIRVEDTVFPLITCPYDIVVLTDGSGLNQMAIDYGITADAVSGDCQVFFTGTAPLTSDNCDIVDQTWTLEAGGGMVTQGDGMIDGVAICPFVNIVTYQVLDGGGNSSTCSFTITVFDNEAPVITQCTNDPNPVLDADENCQAALPDYVPEVIAEDNCFAKSGQLTITQSPAPGTLLDGPDMDHVVTFTATDGFGNSATCTITVTVQDVTNPVADCVDDFILYLDNNGMASLTPADVDDGSSDNCGIVQYELDRDTFTCADAGEVIPVTLTVTDASGNSDACTVNVTVKDPEPPVILNCPDMIMVGNDVDLCSAKVNWSPTQASDDCETDAGISFHFWATGATVYGGDDVPAVFGNGDTPETSDDPLPGNGSSLVYNVGITTVHIIAVDESMNVSDTCVFDIMVMDTQLPILEDCPDDRTVATEPDICQGLVPDLTIEMIVNDNCPLEFTQDPAAGSLFGSAHGDVQTVTVTATDPGGNAVSCDVQLTLNDTQHPEITSCPPARDIDTNPGVCEGTVPDLLSELVATDNCIIASATQTPASGEAFGGSHLETLDVTIEVADEAGLTDTCLVTLTLIDIEAPVIQNCPQDMTVNPNLGCTFQLPDYFATLDYSDNCTAQEDFLTVQTPPAGSTFGDKSGGSQMVTLTLTDEAGLEAECMFTLTLNPTPTPVVSLPEAAYCLGEPFVPVTATSPVPGAVFSWFTQPGNIPVPPAQISGANNQTYTPAAVLGIQTVTVVATYPGNTCVSDPDTVTTTIVSCEISISDPCLCKDNATTLENGQFDETITLTGPSGQTWTVIASAGFYQSGSPAPPAAPLPLPPNTTMTEIPLGGGLSQYVLSGIHVDALGYNLTVSNTEVERSISNRCYYPNPEIAGVFDNYCINWPPVQLVGTATYPPVPPMNNPFPAPQESARFDLVNAMGQVVQSNITQLVPANIVPGQYTLRFTYNAQDDIPSEAYPGCTQILNHPLQIFPQPPLALNCNNKGNVSLGIDGTAEITADDILEGNYGCYDQYQVVITGKLSNIVNCWDVGKTFEVKVIDPITGNSCWGKILVEDKLAPTFITCEDVTVSCNNDALTPGSLGYPEVYDNCGPDNIELTYSEVPQNLTCHPLYDEIIERHWYAKDKTNGMTTTCMQQIFLRKASLGEVVFPANRDDIALPSIPCAQADTTPANTGWPAIDGLPVGGYCEMAMSRKDKVLPICASSYKIVRTWMVMETCTNTMISHDQIIIVSDKQGPAITCPAPDKVVIVNPAWNGCGARIFAPTINVTDNCTLPPGIAMQTSILAGNVLQQLPSNGGFFNVPYGEHTITYRATDLCGNVTTCTTVILLEDKAPPTAVCNDKIVVSLIDEVTYVHAKTFDDGSHDNCSPKVDFLVRRMDNTLCPGNDSTGYAATVPFYCCDVLNGPVGVVLRVYVDKNHNGQQDTNEPYNECMLQVTVQDKIPPVIQCPADMTVACIEDLEPQAPTVTTKIISPNTPISGAYAFTYKDSVVIAGLPANASILDLAVMVDIDHEVVDQLLVKVISPAGTEMVLFNGGSCGVGKKDIQAVFDDQGNTFSCLGHPKAVTGIIQPQGAILSIVNGQNPNGTWVFEITDKAPVGHGLIRKLGVEITSGTPQALLPTGYDNAQACGLEFEKVDLDVKEQCAAGQVIRREWKATDPSGNTDVCLQSITLEDTTPLIVDFPEDVTITDCLLSGLDATGEPEHNGDCELVAVSAVDEMFDVVPGACFKIVRTWTVVDWCKYDKSQSFTNGGIVLDQMQHLWQDDGDGYFKYVQTIKVIDNVPPVVDCPDDFTVESLAANCDSHEVTITLPAADSCTPAGQLKGSWTLDLNDDGSVNMNGTGLTFTRFLPLGSHRVFFTVTDGCGNFTHCSFLFTVVDVKKPTPICITGISVDIMPTTGMVTIQAPTFESGDSYDNCTDHGDLKFLIERFSTMDFTNPVPDADAQPELVFDCADVELGITFVALWVGDAGFDHNGNGTIEDEERNWDYCVTYVEVQNNMGFPCPGNISGTIYGHIKTEWDKEVEDVKVSLTGSGAETMSAQTGWFNFPAMTPGGSYVVVPEKDDAALNGVSTYDMLLIQKHLLGIKPIQSPYGLIAADVNNSGTISISDIIAMRKTLLQAGTTFTDNTSWRFVDSEYTFPNPKNPWQSAFPETVTLHPFTGSTEVSFVGIKIGDISGDAQTTKLLEAETRTQGDPVYLVTDERIVEPGEEVTIPVRLADSRDLEGFQFTLSFDPALEFTGMDAGNLSADHLGFRFLEEGLVAVSWHGDWDDALPVFDLRFRVRDEGWLSRMLAVHSTVLRAEAYLADGQDHRFAPVELRFDRKDTPAEDGLALYQNIPNPFTGHTLIGFNLPTAGQAVLVFHDVSGREVRRILGEYPAGFHQVELTAADFPGAGLYYYTLQFKGRQLTRRMSLLK